MSTIVELPVYRTNTVVQSVRVDEQLLPWILRIAQRWYWNAEGSPRVTFRSTPETVRTEQGFVLPGRSYQVNIGLNRVVWLLSTLTDQEREVYCSNIDALWSALGKFPRVKAIDGDPLNCTLDNLTIKLDKRAISKRKARPEDYLHPMVMQSLDQTGENTVSGNSVDTPSADFNPLTHIMLDPTTGMEVPPPTHRMTAEERHDPSFEDIMSLFQGTQEPKHEQDKQDKQDKQGEQGEPK
jgi:hypothetical protein